MILQIALVLLIFFFFFLTFMVTKKWRWLHVVSLVLVFFTSIAFIFFAAFTLRTQAAWRTIVNQQQADLEEQLKKNHETEFGPDDDIRQVASSLRRAKVELAKTVLDRGRVWRHTILRDASLDASTQRGTVVLELPPRDQAPPPVVDAAPPADDAEADPAAAPAPAPAAGPRHLITAKMVLFAFVEQEVEVDGIPTSMPYYYVGEYAVTNATPLSVTLQSLHALGDYEKNFIRPGTKWTLYEVMPVDGYEHFAHMEEPELRQLLSPERTGLDAGSELYTDMLEGYLRHGQPANDTDPPERVWVEAKFIANHTTTVDAATSTIDANFDRASGQAKNIQLFQGEDTSFEIGDTVLMSAESYDELEQAGKVEKNAIVYQRQLKDYQFIFQTYRRRIAELEEVIELTEENLATAKAVTEKTRQQIAYRQGEKAMLTEDLNHLNDEVEKLSAYLTKLKSFGSALFRRKNALYRDTVAQETRLAEIQATLASMIEERARSAVAEVGTGARNP